MALFWNAVGDLCHGGIRDRLVAVLIDLLPLLVSADSVYRGVCPHLSVLLHGRLRIPGAPIYPPHLDVRHVLLRPLLQLLDPGVHQGQAAPRQ